MISWASQAVLRGARNHLMYYCYYYHHHYCSVQQLSIQVGEYCKQLQAARGHKWQLGRGKFYGTVALN